MRTAMSGMAVLMAAVFTACGSTSPTGASSSTSGSRKIPSSAFSDHTGITKTTVTVGNVSTHLGGLFTGADVGAEAYFNYVNSTGGVNGRKIIVNSGDDNFEPNLNKSLTQQDVAQDAAMVGSFSLQDNYGGQVLAQNPNVPDVSVVLDPTTNKLSNVYSPVPLQGGWQEGSLQYFKSVNPSAVTKAGALGGR